MAPEAVEICDANTNTAEPVDMQWRDSVGMPTSPYEFDGAKSDHPESSYPISTHLGENKADLITSFGFAPMRKWLSGDAVDFLLNHKRWAKTEDCPRVVAQKNLIMMFTIHAEIEDTLCHVPIGPKVDKSKPLGVLQQLLGISYMNGPQAFTFTLAILKAYTTSRNEQILFHLNRGEWPPEPEKTLEKVLVSVVDRRLVFMRTHQPLHCLPISSPRLRLEHHRLKLEAFLKEAAEIDGCFTTFVLLVPQANHKELVKPWHSRSWREVQENLSLPPITDSPNLMWTTAHKHATSAEGICNYVNLKVSEMTAATPDGDSVSDGLRMYKLGVRLACNYISSSRSSDNANTFKCAVLTGIEPFAKDLESHLECNKPGRIGQLLADIQDEFAAVTMLMDPEGVHEILQSGLGLVLSSLVSGCFGLAQWSWVANEVQQGRAAVQTSYEEYLVSGLHLEPHQIAE